MRPQQAVTSERYCNIPAISIPLSCLYQQPTCETTSKSEILTLKPQTQIQISNPPHSPPSHPSRPCLNTEWDDSVAETKLTTSAIASSITLN